MDPERGRMRLAERYCGMADAELLEIAENAASLTNPATGIDLVLPRGRGYRSDSSTSPGHHINVSQSVGPDVENIVLSAGRAIGDHALAQLQGCPAGNSHFSLTGKDDQDLFVVRCAVFPHRLARSQNDPSRTHRHGFRWT